MAIARRKYTNIDFRNEPGTPVFATTTNAVATESDNQVDYTWVGGKVLMDWIQTGANAAIMPIVRTAAPFGWAWPLDADSTDSIEIGEGRLITGNVPYKGFTIGTDDAFFIRMQVSVLSNIDNVTAAMCGFRTSAAQADVTSLATVGSAYNDTVCLGVGTTGGALRTVTTDDTSSVATSLATTGWTVAGTATTGMTFRVNVSAAGACTYLIDGAADASAVAFSLDSTTVVVPCVYLVIANGTGAIGSPVVMQEYECGYQ